MRKVHLLVSAELVILCNDDVTLDDVTELINELPGNDRITIESITSDIDEVLDSK